MSDVDIEASGLLDGLDGLARQQRAELIDWLLGQGFSVEQIRGEVVPMLMPAGRIVGDDGVRVSARQMCDETGIEWSCWGQSSGHSGCPRWRTPTWSSIYGPTVRPPRERKSLSIWDLRASR
jgi:adenylate cyclase